MAAVQHMTGNGNGTVNGTGNGEMGMQPIGAWSRFLSLCSVYS